MQRLPSDWIQDGYDVHVVYTAPHRDEAHALHRAFLAYLDAEGIPYTRPSIFEDPVGPWPTSMWQVLLKNTDPAAIERDLGRCVAWMMLNRGGLSVMIHPNTIADAAFGGHLADHSASMLWMGEPQVLKLDIFR
jgi:aromatic ring-cleaving dioxygenase